MKDILRKRGLPLRRSKTEKGLETQVIRVFNLEKSVTSGSHLLLLDKNKKVRLIQVNDLLLKNFLRRKKNG